MVLWKKIKNMLLNPKNLCYFSIVKKDRRYLLIIIISSFLLAFLVPALVFINRRPVLIIADNTTVLLYGQERAEKKASRAAFSLFRPVRTVAVTDESGDDILLAAISAASEKPYCVIFTARYAEAAYIYSEQNEDIPIIILLARTLPGAYSAYFSVNDNNSDDFYIYSNDLYSDFYLIGQAISAINGEINGRTVIFSDSSVTKQAREAVNDAFIDAGVSIQCSFYNFYSQLAPQVYINCVVLAGAGYEYFEMQSETPVICCGWLDTALLPLEVKLNLDDSPWAQAEEAVRLFKAGEKNSLIPSKAEILNSKYTDKNLVIKLRKILKLNKKK